MKDIRQKLASYARLLYKRAYSIATEGNLSVRLEDDQYLITPSKCIKHFIKPAQMVLINDKGDMSDPVQSASTERYTHLEIYKQNPQAQAIVHAHPHYVLLCSIAGLDPFARPFLIESALFLPRVRYGGFALPSSQDGARAVRDICAGTQAIILEGHGCFTWGDSLEQAFSLLEVMEKTARMYYEAHAAGLELRYLGSEELAALRKVRY